MLKLIQTIFGLVPDAQAQEYDAELIETAIERVVDGTDPRLRAIGGYEKALLPGVRCAIDHVSRLIQDLPPFIELSRSAFGQDERVRSLFVSPDHLQEILLHSGSLQKYLDARPGLDPEGIYGLLAVVQKEKQVFGMQIDGEVVRRDVAQTAVSFTNHRLLEPMDSAEDCRLELEERAFDFLIELALTRITQQRSERANSRRQRELLTKKLDALHSVHWGMDGLLNEDQSGPDRAEVEQRIGHLEAELESLESDPLTLEHYLEIIDEVLQAAGHHLKQSIFEIRIDRMGIKLQEGSDTIPLQFEEISLSDGRRMILLPVYIPFEEIPARPDFLQEAIRYL